jgi:hypothetical protein
VKERPILFSGSMVRALLDGSKTQTRRVVKLKSHQQIEERDDGTPWPWMYDGERDADCWLACPYGQPSDRLWVREAFSGPWCMEAQDGMAAAPPSKWGATSRIWYWADGDPTHGDWTRPRPSIHMPRWASRIALEITSVRVERLQDITRGDAMSEGCPFPNMAKGEDPRKWYADLWNQLNGPAAWDANPWVWVVEFRRLP